MDEYVSKPIRSADLKRAIEAASAIGERKDNEMVAPAVLDRSALDQILEDTGGDPEFIIRTDCDYLGNTRTVLVDLARRARWVTRLGRAGQRTQSKERARAWAPRRCRHWPRKRDAVPGRERPGGRAQVPELQDAFQSADAWNWKCNFFRTIGLSS